LENNYELAENKKMIKHIISLGAGVQSSTMSLMAVHGEITPMPDAAIFADTGGEPKAVYEWLNRLEKLLPFPVYRVENGSLRDAIFAATQSDSKTFAAAPFFITGADGKRSGMLRRQCTREYKIAPIGKKLRELAGLKPRQRSKKVRIIQWQGISLDEIQRARVSHDKWQTYRYPLIEKRITRLQCLEWMRAHNYPEPPRSACSFCPYHTDREWRHLKVHQNEDFLDAVAMDKAIRNSIHRMTDGGKAYIHQSMVPLDEIDFRSAEDAGQQTLFGDPFEEECEGMCGM